MHFYIGYWPIVPRGPPLLRGPDKGLLNDPRKRPAPLLYSSAGLDPNAGSGPPPISRTPLEAR